MREGVSGGVGEEEGGVGGKAFSTSTFAIVTGSAEVRRESWEDEEGTANSIEPNSSTSSTFFSSNCSRSLAAEGTDVVSRDTSEGELEGANSGAASTLGMMGVLTLELACAILEMNDTKRRLLPMVSGASASISTGVFGGANSGFGVFDEEEIRLVKRPRFFFLPVLSLFGEVGELGEEREVGE